MAATIANRISKSAGLSRLSSLRFLRYVWPGAFLLRLFTLHLAARLLALCWLITSEATLTLSLSPVTLRARALNPLQATQVLRLSLTRLHHQPQKAVEAAAVGISFKDHPPKRKDAGTASPSASVSLYFSLRKLSAHSISCLLTHGGEQNG